MSSKGKTATPAPRLRPLELISAAVFLCCLLPSLLGFFGSWGWGADLCAHFRVQYFLVLLASGLLLLCLRRPKLGLLYLAGAAMNLATIVPLYLGEVGVAPEGARPLRALLANVRTGHGSPALVARAIEGCAPDLIVLEEVNRRWLDELSAVLAGYPHAHVIPRPDNFGIALFSRWPLRSSQTLWVGGVGVPSILAHVTGPDGEFRVLATHPVPPGRPRHAATRDQQLAALPEIVAAESSPLLLLGDLNTTPWGASFRRLLAASDLRDSLQGRGPQASWPAGLGCLGIPIDHCLHSEGIVVLDRRIGPGIDSDHLPVIIEFVAVGSGVFSGERVAPGGGDGAAAGRDGADDLVDEAGGE